MPDGSSKETGVTIRSAIDDIAENYKKKVSKASDSLDDAAGIKTINSDIVKKSITKLTDKEKNNLIKVNKIEDLFKDKKLFPKPEQINKQLNLFDIIKNTDETISIKTVRNTLSSLKKLEREASIGSKTGESPDIGAIRFLIKNLEKQLRKDASPAYINEFAKFNALVKENKL